MKGHDHILLAEDDPNLRQGLIDTLEAAGYRVSATVDGEEALAAYHREKPDLLLLDVMMPGLSGYDLCREIRRSDRVTPVIMLTAKGEEIDKVIGLELGADDYVTKPFGLHELRARIAAVLRRSKVAEPTSTVCNLPDQVRFGSALVDRKSYQARLGEKESNLTAREMRLIELFLCYPGEVLDRNRLLNGAWGTDYFGTTRTLDQHIAQLRKKVEPDPARPQTLVTVHGVGYRYLSPDRE